MKKLIILLMLCGCTNTLREVNDKVNAHPYIKDVYNCRNYATDKYEALVKLGYHDEKMQFIITSFHGQPHVVLNVDGWILDNAISNIYPATKNLREGMTPQFWLKVNSLIQLNN